MIRPLLRRGSGPPSLLHVPLSIALAVLVFAGDAMAAGGGKPVGKIVHVVDTRNMPAGLTKFISDVYNTNMVLFGLLVVVTMAGMGASLGFLFDKAVGLLGINLGKLDHHE